MDNLILELIEVKIKKSVCARNQNYENAASLRDIEKVLEKRIYHIITSSEVDNNYLSVVYKETIGNYILENYGYDYPNFWQNLDTGKALIRELKLKIVGI